MDYYDIDEVIPPILLSETEPYVENDDGIPKEFSQANRNSIQNNNKSNMLRKVLSMDRFASSRGRTLKSCRASKFSRAASLGKYKSL